ncbi:UNVERIFIED_CONTAM: Heat shock protein beta-11 [Siphonaria sp. JEL0065]|nr:Heat shock protein beta-11 [Siphonaria sp. JEL0065]
MASGVPSENIHGLRVSMITSADQRFPAENMLDGTTKTFWVSTGLYPQEFIITLPTLYVIKKITIWSMKVAGWTISRSGSDKQFDFDEVYSEDIEDTPDSTLQITTFSVSYSDAHRAAAAKHVKFTIRKGYSDFAAVHRVTIQGEAVPERGQENTTVKKNKSKVRSGGRDESDEDEDGSGAEDEVGDDDNERSSRVVKVKERD